MEREAWRHPRFFLGGNCAVEPGDWLKKETLGRASALERRGAWAEGLG